MTQQYSRFMRWTSRMVIMCMLAMGLPVQSALAGIVATDQIVSHDLAGKDRANISAFIDRGDVLAQLQQRGVSAAEAKARVLALTDDEAHRIAGKLEQLPAGSGGFGDILDLLFSIFILLLLTDILGFTKVFPFTRSVR